MAIRKMMPNMLVGLEVYSRERGRKSWRDIVAMVECEAGCSEWQLLNALKVIGKLNDNGIERLEEVRKQMEKEREARLARYAMNREEE